MDTQNGAFASDSGNLPDLADFSLIVGGKRLQEAVKDHRIRHVFLAADADPVHTEPLCALCADHGVPVTWVPERKQLGRACGIDVGTAAAGIAAENADSTGEIP